MLPHLHCRPQSAGFGRGGSVVLQKPVHVWVCLPRDAGCSTSVWPFSYDLRSQRELWAASGALQSSSFPPSCWHCHCRCHPHRPSAIISVCASIHSPTHPLPSSGPPTLRPPHSSRGPNSCPAACKGFQAAAINALLVSSSKESTKDCEGEPPLLSLGFLGESFADQLGGARGEDEMVLRSVVAGQALDFGRSKLTVSASGPGGGRDYERGGPPVAPGWKQEPPRVSCTRQATPVALVCVGVGVPVCACLPPP